MEAQNRVERRRAPRCPARIDVQCRIEVRARVRVVDISASGALLAADTLPPVGSLAQFKAALGVSTFASEVEIKRRAHVGEAAGLGVAFTTMDERNQRSLNQFLTKANS
jgi:c-di-GMP-binding flagellar brake protein YcgR